MAETNTTRRKTKATRLSPKEKKAAQAAAARAARRQWIILGLVLAIIAVGAIVLISIFTDGSLPQNFDPNAGIR